MKIEVIGPRTGKYTGDLLSAAPEMLEALSELVAEWDALHADETHRTGYTLDTLGIQLARAAIAKATGEKR